MNPQSTPAAATPPATEPNIQNVNPNVIHSTTVSSVSSHIPSASPVTTPANNKSQVITQNIHVKQSVSSKDERQPESLVVSVPLSSATTVPGIQLPTTNSSNINSNTNSTVSTIVTNQAQTSSPTIQLSSSVLAPQGSLYQHLTNNQSGNQRASPLIQQSIGRASPLTPTPSPLINESHGINNHTSVLQNMNSGSVIASAGFPGVSTSVTETTSSGMLKVTYEKQATSRIHAIQHEESSRRSR